MSIASIFSGWGISQTPPSSGEITFIMDEDAVIIHAIDSDGVLHALRVKSSDLFRDAQQAFIAVKEFQDLYPGPAKFHPSVANMPMQAVGI